MKKHLKKIAATMLAFLTIVSVLTIAVPEEGIGDIFMTAHAATSGTCGDNLTWSLSSSWDATLTISGTGAMYDYSRDNPAPWNSAETLSKIVINEGVTHIGNYAFRKFSNSGLMPVSEVTVSLPDSLLSIGDYAFGPNCDIYEPFVLPPNIESIGCYILYDHEGINSDISIPASVTYLDPNAFTGLYSLENINVDNGNNTYCSIDGIVYNKDITETITCPVKKAGFIVLPETVTTIGDYAFYCCSSLNSINIPDSVIDIGEHAFHGCSSLTDINLPSGLFEIGYYSFHGCSSLTSICIPDGAVWFNSAAMMYCSSLTSVIIPDSVQQISISAFEYCTNIKDVYYSGSESEWNNITIQDGNECLTNATIHYNWVDVANDYIIDEVKKYTSQEMCDLYLAIMDSDASYEVKYKVLNDFFESYGLTDVREGTKYLSDTTSHRHSYLYLTTDEIYCAYNFYEWLYTTPKGFAARSALYADGLIFNYEVFSYLDLSTYDENDYPGVKKNKAMLKQFMSYEDPSNIATQALEYGSLSADFLGNLLDLNDLNVDDNINSLLNKIATSSSSEQTDKYIEKLLYDYIIPQIEANTSTDKVYIEGKQFSTALNYAGTILEFAGATAEDIVLLMNLSNEIAMYQKYENFLRTIYECTDVSFEMRLAAYSLLDEMENGYMNRIRSILGNFITFGTNMMLADVNMWEEMCGEGGALFADALTLIKVATFISNIVIDTGDFVKQAAYTQGFAELSTLYCLKLKEDKAAFLASPTAENAWQFYEDYNILWNLRYQGEEQYLKMNEVKALIFAKIKLQDYELKEEIVNDTRAHLLTCRFDLSSDIVVPESVQYISKTVVNCPVDVEVYASDGTLITTLKDGIESDITNEYGRFAVVYQPYSGEYAKVICNATDKALNIKAFAVDDGYVDVAFADNSDNLCVYTFDNVEVSTGDIIEFTTNIDDTTEYTIDVAGDGSVDNTGLFTERDESAYVQVESISTEETSFSMTVGETKNIDVVVTPSNATNNFVAWLSSDENIVTVDNGTVTAVGTGTANIYAYAIDDSSLLIEFEVTVMPLAKPTNLYAYTFGYTSIKMTWDAVEGADGYEIYRCDRAGQPYYYIDEVGADETAYRNIGLSTGTTYYYKVRAFVNLEDGTKAYSDLSAYSSARPLPATPVVTVTRTSATTATVSWVKIYGATGYSVYRSTEENGTYTFVANLKSGDSTTYEATGLASSKTYYYKVRAYRQMGDDMMFGSYSKAAAAFGAPATPVITARSVGYTSAKVVWEPVENADGYAIYRCDVGGGSYSYVASVGTDVTSYTNTGLSTGTTYYYKVRAYMNVGSGKLYSNYSLCATARPIPATPVVTVTADSATTATVSWVRIYGATGYSVYRSTEKDGTYAFLTGISSGDTVTYTDKNLDEGVTYYYKVRAYRQMGSDKMFSNYSLPVCAKQD